MGPEAKLYQKLRKNSKGITWNRIENLSSLGTPDLLGYNSFGHFFTVELKVTRGNKLKFSPHQIAFHKTHPKNTFIIAEALGYDESVVRMCLMERNLVCRKFEFITSCNF